MGGTASPLTWTLGYDPIIEGGERAVGAGAAVYVDDSSARTCGPEQTLRAQYFTLAAGHCAGLRPATHECRLADVALPRQAVCAALASLPVTITAGGPGQVTVRGIPPEVVQAILEHVEERPVEVRIRRRPCTCGIKSAFVPAWDLDGWRDDLVMSPGHPGGVQPAWTCLGVTVAGRTTGPRPTCPGLEDEALARVRDGTWAKAADTLDHRVQLACERHGSPGHRAATWHDYIASLVPYPAQTCLPGDQGERRLLDGLRRLIPSAGWAPHFVVTALGAILALRGAPRCPVAAAAAVGAVAWARTGGWGPEQEQHRQRDECLADLAWARALSARAGGTWRHPRPRLTIRALAALDGPVGAPARDTQVRAGPHLYRAAWGRRYGALVQAWLRRRSAGRRWYPSDGAEWRLVACADNFNQ